MMTLIDATFDGFSAAYRTAAPPPMLIPNRLTFVLEQPVRVAMLVRIRSMRDITVSLAYLSPLR
jgi:hypothetical protein